MMFRGTFEKNRLLANMSDEQKYEVNDEYYTNIEALEQFVIQHHATLTSQAIDDVYWVVSIDSKK